MCAVYVICKVTDNNERSFMQIMQSYKTQPQATNNIYRNMLLYRKGDKDETGNVLTENKKGNLIQFYNSVFVKSMTSFAVKFSSKSNQKSKVHISPMPSVKSLMASPIHQVTKNVFIKSYESPGSKSSGGKCYSYFFSRSASKDLKDINKAIQLGSTRKRLLTDDGNCEGSDLQVKRIANRKVQTLLEERRVQNME